MIGCSSQVVPWSVLVACLRSVDLSVGFPVVWPVKRLSVGSAVVIDGITSACFGKIRSLSDVWTVRPCPDCSLFDEERRYTKDELS